MARREAELVIKAREEAVKVVDSVTKALNSFTAAQTETDAAADKTSSSLSGLGAAVKLLDTNIKGLAVGKKLSADLDDASASLSRMEDKLERTGSEARQLEADLKKTEAQSAKYATSVDKATRAQDRQQISVRRTKASQKELAAAYGIASRAQAKLETRQAKLPGLIERQNEAVLKASARYADLSDKISATINPSKTLEQQFASSAASLEKSEAKLVALRGEYAGIGTSIRAAGSAAAIFGAKSEQATAKVARQQEALKQTNQDLRTLKVQASAAATEQGKLASAASKISKSMDAQRASIAKAEQDYVELAVGVGRADVALEKLGRAGANSVLRAFGQQRTAAQAAKASYAELSAEATRLGAEVSRVGVPTRELAASFEQTKIKARAAKEAWIAQQNALQQVRGAYRSLSGDLSNLQGVQNQVVAAQGKLVTSLERTEATAKQQAAAVDKIYGSAVRATRGADQFSASLRRQAVESRKAASETSRLTEAYRSFYGDTRKSLSLLQRIRGEILSLVAAYAGLYAGVEVIRGTITATQQLEAIQSRLNVAFGGDQTKAAREYEYIRRQADRLGISLSLLGKEYSSFAVATRGTNLEGEKTRKIFIAVAEAARVNRSSSEELEGVFKALVQIVSKGTVQMEELKGQLGDRLPGAMQLMADAVGVTTAELFKMIEAGELTSDALVPFATELEKRFGPALADALKQTSANIGRLGNEAFQAAIKFGQGGFLDAFNRLVVHLTETLKSADFQAFMDRASSALAGLTDGVAFAVKNFRALAAVGAAFIGLRLTPLFLAAGSAMVAMARKARDAAAGMTVLAGASARTAGSATLLTGAMRGLMSATGVGIAVTAISAGLALWGTRADEASTALNTHEEILDKVKAAYEGVGGAVDDWRDNLVDLTLVEAEQNLRRLEVALESVKGEFNGANALAGKSAINPLPFVLQSGANSEFREAIQQLIRDIRAGDEDIANLVARIDEIATEFSDGSDASRRYAEALIETARKVETMSGAVDEGRAIVKSFSDDAAESSEAIRELGVSSEDSGTKIERGVLKSAEGFAAAMAELGKRIPEVKRELDYLAESDAIEKFLLKSIQAASTWKEILQAMTLAGRAQIDLDQRTGAAAAGSIEGFSGATDGTRAAAALLRKSEGFRSTPYWDVNADRIGYGSDTITLSDGTIQKVTKGMRVSVADANRDLERRISTEFLPKVRSQAGTARFDAMSPQQQGVLTSIAYNYGSLPERIIGAVKTGTDQQIAQAIRGLGGDNDGVNEKRRNEEASLFVSGAGEGAQVSRQQSADDAAAREEQRKAEAAERDAQRDQEAEDRRRASTQQRLADGEFEVEQQERKNAGLDRQAAIQAAIREARAADPNITEAEIAKITELTGKQYDLAEANKATANAKKGVTDETKAAKAAQEQVNQLVAQRAELEKQLKIAQEAGDTSKVEELTAKIAELNAKIIEASANAQALWQAVGGAAADTATAKLQTATAEAENFGDKAKKTKLDWSGVADLFVNGLTSAFDSFAQKVAEGQSVGEAARESFLQFAADFLREIGTMILKQILLNALRGLFGGTGFGSAIGVGTAHTGGLIGSVRAGSGNGVRSVDPGLFANAQRFHTGGVIGLGPNEVPIVAQKGEEMLTRNDPRHVLNGGGAGQKPAGTSVKVINTLDPAEVLAAALDSPAGTEVLMNVVSRQKAEIKAELDV